MVCLILESYKQRTDQSFCLSRKDFELACYADCESSIMTYLPNKTNMALYNDYRVSRDKQGMVTKFNVRLSSIVDDKLSNIISLLKIALKTQANSPMEENNSD